MNALIARLPCTVQESVLKLISKITGETAREMAASLSRNRMNETWLLMTLRFVETAS
jgi:hypothetical protein